MLYLEYGSKDWSLRAWDRIKDKQPVTVQIYGKKREFIYKLMLNYNKRIQNSIQVAPLGTNFLSLGWRSIFAPSIMGLCVYARSTGMVITISEQDKSLDFKFQNSVK